MDAVKMFFRDQAQIVWKEAWQAAHKIGTNPELGYQEYFAVETLTQLLKNHGFAIERPAADLETAFIARYTGHQPGPCLAFLAEYDALPGIGHGCGHNLIGAASVGAAIALSKSLELPGEIWVVGSPAEETSGGKVTLVNHGVFDKVDAALMFHPGSQNVSEISSLALDALEFVFQGKVAHAVAAPHHGINALDALIDFFNRINLLKKKMDPDLYINGIITEGGASPNVIPERAVARFYLRARQRKTLNALRKLVIRCAQDAASVVSAKVTWSNFEHSYDELLTNRTLANAFEKNLRELGVNTISPPQSAMGSVDLGNVSRVVPAIHPYLVLGKGMDIPHTREFSRACLSSSGERLLLLAIQSLALTGWDILSDPVLLNHAKRELKAYRG
ncbi:amidohydrolase [Desulfitobacterium dichloroeliminans LMG P-21439]|uniref:Peptidase M20 domain-containing protein 2 n=1 Tax=Desulfitobacterium dichloroeliminans (strain LMG P-21439 / DCA1) TaxID=871963 RepID=L0F4J6_DESDL|nr:M20 family metallopeptidase [Desulfitobacterium dichloroeliminans]AGA68087.1 amidohydrolase [Desulfitobacterium dichloroeliminans LMG P-21439]